MPKPKPTNIEIGMKIPQHFPSTFHRDFTFPTFDKDPLMLQYGEVRKYLKKTKEWEVYFEDRRECYLYTHERIKDQMKMKTWLEAQGVGKFVARREPVDEDEHPGSVKKIYIGELMDCQWIAGQYRWWWIDYAWDGGSWLTKAQVDYGSRLYQVWKEGEEHD